MLVCCVNKRLNLRTTCSSLCRHEGALVRTVDAARPSLARADQQGKLNGLVAPTAASSRCLLSSSLRLLDAACFLGGLEGM